MTDNTIVYIIFILANFMEIDYNIFGETLLIFDVNRKPVCTYIIIIIIKIQDRRVYIIIYFVKNLILLKFRIERPSN